MALGVGKKPSPIPFCIANFTSGEVFLFCGFGREPVTHPAVGTVAACDRTQQWDWEHWERKVFQLLPVCRWKGAAVSSVLVAPELWRLWISSLRCPAQGGAVLEEGEITAPPGTLPALERLQRLWDVPGAHGMKTNRARGSWAGSEIQGIAGGKDPTRRKGCR